MAQCANTTERRRPVPRPRNDPRTGTFGGALEARGIDASDGRLTSEAEGEIYLVDKTLVIKKIHVRYTLRGCPDDRREAAERSHAFHASRCPVAKSIEKAIEISTALAFE